MMIASQRISQRRRTVDLMVETRMECIRTIRATSISEIRSMSRKVATKRCLIALMTNYLTAISSRLLLTLPSTLRARLRAHTTAITIHLSNSEIMKPKGRPTLLSPHTLHPLQPLLQHLQVPLHLLHKKKTIQHHLVTLTRPHLLISQIFSRVSLRIQIAPTPPTQLMVQMAKQRLFLR
jgi:hypothetical protein